MYLNTLISRISSQFRETDDELFFIWIKEFFYVRVIASTNTSVAGEKPLSQKGLIANHNIF